MIKYAHLINRGARTSYSSHSPFCPFTLQAVSPFRFTQVVKTGLLVQPGGAPLPGFLSRHRTLGALSNRTLKVSVEEGRGTGITGIPPRSSVYFVTTPAFLAYAQGYFLPITSLKCTEFAAKTGDLGPMKALRLNQKVPYQCDFEKCLSVAKEGTTRGHRTLVRWLK